MNLYSVYHKQGIYNSLMETTETKLSYILDFLFNSQVKDASTKNAAGDFNPQFRREVF